jgi:hypothetical protein
MQVLAERIPQSVPAQEVDPSSDIGMQCTPGMDLMHVEQRHLKQQFSSMVRQQFRQHLSHMLKNESTFTLNLRNQVINSYIGQ